MKGIKAQQLSLNLIIFLAVTIITVLPALSAVTETVTVQVEGKYRSGMMVGHRATSSQELETSGQVGGYLLAYTGDKELPYRFELINNTVIKKGKITIAPDQLPTPCKARVKYQRLRSGYSNAVEITVLSVASDATTAWSKPDNN